MSSVAEFLVWCGSREDISRIQPQTQLGGWCHGCGRLATPCPSSSLQEGGEAHLETGRPETMLSTTWKLSCTQINRGCQINCKTVTRFLSRLKIFWNMPGNFVLRFTFKMECLTIFHLDFAYTVCLEKCESSQNSHNFGYRHRILLPNMSFVMRKARPIHLEHKNYMSKHLNPLESCRKCRRQSLATKNNWEPCLRRRCGRFQGSYNA